MRWWLVRYRCDPQRVVLGTARSRAGGVGKSLSALCCRVCNSVSRCARSVGSQVAQWWSGGVVRGNFDACVQRGRVCGLRSFTRGRGSGPRTDQNSEKGMSRPPPLSTVSTNLSPFVSSHAPLIAIIGCFPTQSAFWLRCPLRGVRTGRLASRASPLDRAVRRWPSRRSTRIASSAPVLARGLGMDRSRTEAPKTRVYFTAPVWGLSGAPSPHRRPRRTGKSVDCEQNNGIMVHLDGSVADTRIFGPCADLHINAQYLSRRIPRLVRIKRLGSVNVEAGWTDSTTNKRKETNINSGVV